MEKIKSLIQEIESADDGSPQMMRLANAASLLNAAYLHATPTEETMMENEALQSWATFPSTPQEEDRFLTFSREAQSLVFAGVTPNWESLLD